MTTLDQKLRELAGGAGNYPFHMPGHKRHMTGDFPDPYSIDITEIGGFDDLHHPENILLEEQESAAKIYGSKKCFFLVNGSTCGILAAISAATHRGDKIIVARNCHKSVYNAIFLRQLSPIYVYPADTEFGFPGQINPADIEKTLAENPDANAVVITSPTYEGLVSDVKEIAEITHKYNIPLIVDEAHGAHLGLHPAFPENATRLGADAVIMSTHKTLPAFTQSAQLHLCGDRIDAATVQNFLGIYESSSPSYVLLCGLSRCMAMLRDPATQDRIENYIKMLEGFRKKTQNLKYLCVLSASDILHSNSYVANAGTAQHDSSDSQMSCSNTGDANPDNNTTFNTGAAYDYDIGKIIISAKNTGLTGEALRHILAEKYRLELEMAGPAYALAMTSFMDEKCGFDRLAEALLDIDKNIGINNPLMPMYDKNNTAISSSSINSPNPQITISSDETFKHCNQSSRNGKITQLAESPSLCASSPNLYRPQEKCLEIHEALESPRESVPLAEAESRICADYVCLYPPGIPILAPGERINAQTINNIMLCIKQGLSVQGIDEKKCIYVTKK